MSLISRYVVSNKGRVLSIVHSHVGMIIGRSMSSGGDRVNEDLIAKSVFISQSKDIFTNLALEDWLYRNYDFKNHHVLLLWRNDPCVVIGRHQNPWIEANIQGLEEQGIAMARRNSGGGTVYHDSGNLNLSFFTPKERYNRRYNLEIITRALYREWGLRSDINQREDIVVNGNLKVSGTAAKLGRPNAYHHCTLLVNVNKENLRMALEKKETGISHSKATESTRSPVKNLSEINGRVTTDALMSAVGWEYLRTMAMTLEDGGHSLVQKQKGFQMINPTEQWFPGLDKLKDDFQSWEWNYGRCPKFTVTRDLKIPADSTNSTDNGPFHQLKLTLEVKNGIVEDIKLSLPPDVLSNAASQDASVITHLRGAKYDHDITEKIISALERNAPTKASAKTELH
ncbi:lipoyltransferase 1, mitochondrial isoform X2 [Diachasma alloeum]|uniref:lipoyltransferase 1, mitochondrial isoform X2 n=1 Tax=Diachasma alloeum TaxID=454923 RepID=UPI00073830CA|nr:lipoyltransferase 1, mitochondrial isoform X2 [Diachasma alloeum]